MNLAEAAAAAAAIDARAANDGIPRTYNFAADILGRNLRPGAPTSRPSSIRAGPGPTASWPTGWNGSAMCCARSASRARSASCSCLPDTIDWPTAFLGAIKAGVRRDPGQHADDRGRLPLHARRQPRQGAGRLARRCCRNSPSLIGPCPDLAHVIVSGANAHGHRRFEDLLAATRPDPDLHTAPTTRDDMCFWLYTSGSTGKPKGAVHVHADLAAHRRPLRRGRSSASPRTTSAISVAKLFFAYGLGNALTFPMSVGATTVLLPDRPTPELVGRDRCASTGRRCSTRCRPSTPRSWRARARRSARHVKLRLLRLGRRGAAAPTSAGAGASATASTSSTASARPRCCTSSSPTVPAT